MERKHSDQEIKAALSDRHIRVVADRTGIFYQTIFKFIWGKTKNLTDEIYQKLATYLFGDY